MSKLIRGIVFLIAGICLFVFSLSQVDLFELFLSLKNLFIWKFVVLFCIFFTGIIVIGSMRWKWILRAQGYSVPLKQIIGAKSVGFAISYLTPTVFLGGEPFRYMLLKKLNNKIPPETLAASIFLDKLAFLVMSSFSFFVGLFFLDRYLPLFAGWRWLILGIGVLFFCGIPLLIIGLKTLLSKKSLLLWIFAKLQLLRLPVLKNNSSKIEKFEQKIDTLFRYRFYDFLGAIIFAFFEILLLLVGYWLIIDFIARPLVFDKILSINSFIQGAYFLPFPGGLGTFEVSQVFLFQQIGLSKTVGMSFSLIVRAINLLMAFGALFYFIVFQFLQLKSKLLKLINFDEKKEA